jgi:hypothetical protein
MDLITQDYTTIPKHEQTKRKQQGNVRPEPNKKHLYMEKCCKHEAQNAPEGIYTH